MRRPTKSVITVLGLLLVVAACNSTSPTAPDTITIDPANAAVTGGRSVVLTATTTEGDVISQSVAWSSSNPLIASVDDRGVVTGGYGEGTATITASGPEGTGSALVELVRLCAELAPITGTPDPASEIQSFSVRFAAGTNVQQLADSLAASYGFSIRQMNPDGFTAELTPTQAAGVGCARDVVEMTYL